MGKRLVMFLKGWRMSRRLVMLWMGWRMSRRLMILSRDGEGVVKCVCCRRR